MNQSNKKNFEFIKNYGVNYFLQDSARNWFEISSNNKNEVKNHKTDKIQEIIEKIRSYNTPLKKSANNLVVYDGNLDAKIMFIGEAPGRDEDIRGLPFVGKAGQLLNKMLNAINLKREDVYITNVINWRPPENRTPTDDEILEFLPFLQKQIDVVNPDYIFLLGVIAAKAVLTTSLSISKLRNKWHIYHSLELNKKINTIASYHPAFLLRSPKYKKESWEDLKKLKKKIDDEK